MLYFIVGCIIILIFINIKSVIRFKKAYLFLNKKYDLKINIKRHIIVVIPAMNEVDNVEESINYFKELNDICEIIYVTTLKEKSMQTYNKINDEIRKKQAKNIRVINSPNTVGTMANQLNYVIKNLKDNDIIAIYNIDSKPERKTFKYVLNNITLQLSILIEHFIYSSYII